MFSLFYLGYRDIHNVGNISKSCHSTEISVCNFDSHYGGPRWISSNCGAKSRRDLKAIRVVLQDLKTIQGAAIILGW